MGTMVHTEHPVLEGQKDISDGIAFHSLDMYFADLVISPSYYLTNRWFLRSSFPVRTARTDVDFLGENREVLTDMESIHHRNEILVGMGDMGLGIGYRLWSTNYGAFLTTLDLTVGATLPTGGTEPDPFEAGRQGKKHQHIIFGTGTVDPTFKVSGIVGSGTHLFTLWANIRRPLYENAHGMKTGAQISHGIGWVHGFGLQNWQFMVQPEIFYEEATTWNSGEDSPNSGRTDLVATVAAFWQYSPDVRASLTLKRPFTIQTSGGQLEMPLVVAVGADFRFSLD